MVGAARSEGFPRRGGGTSRLKWALLALATASCSPELVVGTWSRAAGGESGSSGASGVSGSSAVSGTGGVGAVSGTGGTSGEVGESGAGGDGGEGTCEPATASGAGGDGSSDVLVVPWSMGFEREFCEYKSQGFCYAARGASYEVVDSPVLSGKRAAAFTIDADGTMRGHQTRCVREGVLPVAGYYTANFLVPEVPTLTDKWNLVHFRGGEWGAFHGLWDVSLQLQRDGSLRLFVFDHERMDTIMSRGVPPIPVGEWFEIQVYLRRAADDTGEISVYQDGDLAVQLTGLSTDDTNIGQWYVGNFAGELMPRQSTIYVDDVSMREAP